jgi:penicillin amidase
VDTLTISRYLAYGLGTNWTSQLFRAQLVKAVGVDQARELFPLATDPTELADLAEIELPDLDRLLEMGASTVRAATGGNGWVVSGAKSKSGAAMLANDPHLAASNPAPWYQTHLIGPNGMDVTGAAFPGLPGILLGHNRDIAWGMSSQAAAAQDLVIEQRNPDALDQFRFRGRWEKAVSVREEIRVRDAAQPVQHDVLITRHGPVIAAGRTTALALRWTGFTPSAEIEAVLAINRARSWGDFRQALEGYSAPAMHVLFAGRDGTIACRAAGTIPIRARGDGQTPVPGWTGMHEWRGAIPFEGQTEQVNPEAGFIIAADGDTSYRGRRVAERLHASTAVTIEKLQDLQQDTVNTQARSLLQVLLNAVQEGLRQGTHPETLSQAEKHAMLMISGWDCSETPEAPQPALWHQWFMFLTEEIFRPHMGLAMFDQFIAHGMPGPTTDRLIHQVAQGEQSLWLTREGEGSLGRVVLHSFRRAVALLSAKQGQKPEGWAWGQEHRVSFIHPLTEERRGLGLLLNLGPYPVAGSAATINHDGGNQFNPFLVSTTATWRQVVDMAGPDEALGVCAPGQSGHPLSGHARDQIHAWLRGEYLPLLFRHSTIRTLPCLVLQPAPEPQPPADQQAEAAD